ncbi:hypothetical protein DSCO28_10160 [Desulfosarcina ovata subsp. sediminis]|uniref:Uncharacterized protein n=1 Tax=Desulfosarcina ovata subsp. sediminis TaxID=885957 RepID=A0A5K7ZNY9_9BACT|nr:hypothetical protein [Desulfosarcina ovata]BBO80450.1 hypothetical protein DSCO28_10160 [Desulfosarcina ovata subsp. sediminis]
MSSKFIADEISEDDSTAGFEEKSIDNPNGHYCLESPQIPAVICEVGPSDRIIKLNEINGIPYYKHQRYGLWPFQTDESKATWLQCGDEYWFRPDDAVAAVKAKVGKECGSVPIKVIEPPH